MTEHGHRTVRRAGVDEAEVVAGVWLRSRHATVPANPAIVHTDDEVREWFTDVVLPSREVWVVEVDDTVVGVMVLDGDDLDQLHVEPGWTGQGVGADLVAVAKAQRPAGLHLWTFQANTGARRFYEREGFIAVRTTDGDNEEGEPDVQYRWSAPE